MQSTTPADGLSPYHPAPAGNAFMLAAFAALAPVSIYTGFRYKTPLYTSLTVVSLLAEIVGHSGAAVLQFDQASRSLFCLFMIGTLWGATLLGSVNYLTLPRVMVIYGKNFSLVSRPIYFSICFVVLDIFALVFQSAGIALASGSTTAEESTQSLRILLAGLALQTLSISAFLAVFWYFKLRLHRRHHRLDLEFSVVFSSSRFNAWLLCLQISSLLLLIRAVVRIAAFSYGFDSSLTGSQLATFTVDDVLVLLAAMILVAAPAGRAFGPSWKKTSPFGCSEGLMDLPLQRRHLSRKRRINTMSISKPYASTATFLPPNGSPSFQRAGPAPSPMASPYPKLFHVRPAYHPSRPPALPPKGPWGSPRFPETLEKKSIPQPPDTSSRLVQSDSLW